MAMWWYPYGESVISPSRGDWVERADGSTEEIPSKRVFTLHKGESLHVDTPGGGGYGDPLERDPEAVRQDVYDRRVTVLMARQQYGVVLQEPGLSVDQEATQRLRTTLRARRVEALRPTQESVKRDGTSGKE